MGGGVLAGGGGGAGDGADVAGEGGGVGAVMTGGGVGVRRVVTGVVVVVVTLFVVVNLRPWAWFLDTTPTGGDMGAHVWAPDYLRDVLLGDLRLTGWSHDWYAGFPAFTFYMVIPSLLVVVVETGLGLPVSFFAYLAAAAAALLVSRRLPAGWIGFVGLRLGGSGRGPAMAGAAAVGLAVVAMGVLDRLDRHTVRLRVGPGFDYDDAAFDLFMASVVGPVAAGCLVWSWPRLRDRAGWARLPATAMAVAVAVLVTPVPYGVAFKLVAVAGLVALPAAVYLMARLGGLAFPGPALAAAAVVPFVFDRSFNIYGGNLMSTMAGEFAYSLGLLGTVVYMGVVSRGLTTGGRRVVAGVLLALAGLTHLFSVFLALAFTAAFLSVGWAQHGLARIRGPKPGSAAARAPGRGLGVRDGLRWVVVVGPMAGLLSAWWVLPFFWNRGMLNDMGWGKQREYVSALWSRVVFDYDFLANDPPLQIFVVMAAAGAVICLIRRVRFGVALALTAAMLAAAFVILPEGRLWNVRILPYYYFSIYVMAAVGLGEASRLVGWLAAGLRWQPPGTGADSAPRKLPGWLPPAVATAVAGTGVAAVLVMVGLPLRSLPGGRVNDQDVYQWGPLGTEEFNLGGFWVEYNFEGYERRDPTAAGGGTPEYTALVNTMTEVGRERGCGRSLWEYELERLGSYGTPMAPMLLPYWTDGCIGSMEGLYFEASATTPYHFLMQSELSAAPSRSQRDLPYRELDVAAGVDHLQRMGVRYYLAFSGPALQQAWAQPDLREVATAGPWVIFEVADSDLVVGLDALPVVVDDLEDAGYDWLEVSVGAFQIPDGPVLAAEGPDEWPTLSLADLGPDAGLIASRASPAGRVAVIQALTDRLAQTAPRQPAPPAAVSDLTWENQSISFRVDRTGTPVLVRASYFPNWAATGADGPYRVTPNLMAIVPTDNEVTLKYSRSPVELAAMLLTLTGLAWAARLAWRTRPGPAR